MSTSAMHGPLTTRDEMWKGVAVLALAAIGVLHVIGGITAVARTEGLDLATMPILADYRAYGWGFIVSGALLLASAVGAWFGKMWARILGGVLLALSFLNNLALPGGVLLSIVLMAVALIGIYAIVMHVSSAREAATS